MKESTTALTSFPVTIFFGIGGGGGVITNNLSTSSKYSIKLTRWQTRETGFLINPFLV